MTSRGPLVPGRRLEHAPRWPGRDLNRDVVPVRASALPHHFYDASPEDPALYDLTIDSTSMSVEDCVNAIVAAAGGSASDAQPSP
jgi:hypothetical protein